jgi:hypothetical protein
LGGGEVWVRGREKGEGVRGEGRGCEGRRERSYEEGGKREGV